MNDVDTVATLNLCAGGCGEPMALGEGMCEDCAELARYYDAAELLPHARTAPESAHLGAVEQAPQRGLFTFLGWKRPGPLASAERVRVESGAAPRAADPQRRSELLATLPRVQCGVQRMCALERVELWYSEVPIYTVAAVVAWDLLRWIGCATMDSLACFASRRLRGRLSVTGMVLHPSAWKRWGPRVLGAALGLAASCAAWMLR